MDLDYQGVVSLSKTNADITFIVFRLTSLQVADMLRHPYAARFLAIRYQPVFQMQAPMNISVSSRPRRTLVFMAIALPLLETLPMVTLAIFRKSQTPMGLPGTVAHDPWTSTPIKTL